ncbi:MAG: ATP-binding protein [Clostridiales bacterium]|nr:ATP-binding protein [Clostridiales bacterium]
MAVLEFLNVTEKRENLFFYPIDEAYIAILDDGSGMADTELDTAMQYGSRNPSEVRDADDLGRFGLPLEIVFEGTGRDWTLTERLM